MKQNLLISVTLIMVAAGMRLVPHPWNVAPVAAAALLAGAVLPRKWALAVPIFALLASDFFLGAYHLPVMLTVYACFVLSALIGSYLKDMRTIKILGAALASSTVFFIVTNFAVWASGEWYEKSWQGLMLCYTLAIPFFRNTMLGDLMFTGVMFGAWLVARQLIQHRLPLAIYESKK